MTKLAGCVLLGLLLVLTSATAAQDNSTPTSPFRFYTVQPGDTLASIARLFDISTAEVLDANNLTDANVIFSGTRLRIPLKVTATLSESMTPTATLTPRSPRPTQTITPTFESPTAIPRTPTRGADAATTPAAGLPFEVGGVVSGFGQVEVMRDAGMTWIAFPLRWDSGDAVSRARAVIDQAHRNGFNVLLQISGDPQGLVDDAAGYYRQFAAYLGEVAAFAPDAIQVWDSMNSPEAWARGLIGPGSYTQMLREAFRAIKTVNPDVLVISGGLAQTVDHGGLCQTGGCDDLPYLRGLAASGAAQYADCIGMSYTVGAVAPDTAGGDPRGDEFLYYYPTLISSYAIIFPNKPLCLTSFGYFVPGDAAPEGFEWAAGTSPQDAANWLDQAAQLAAQSGRVRLMMIYNIDATQGTAANYAITRGDECIACEVLK